MTCTVPTRAVAGRFARNAGAALCGATVVLAIVSGLVWLLATGVRAVFRWLDITAEMAAWLFVALFCAIPVLMLWGIVGALRDAWQGARREVEGERWRR